MQGSIFSGILVGLALLGACAPLTESQVLNEPYFERQLIKNEPAVYCYKSLGDDACYAMPYDRDQRRLIGFYGLRPE